VVGLFNTPTPNMANAWLPEIGYLGLQDRGRETPTVC
jgi:hypothetical protein